MKLRQPWNNEDIINEMQRVLLDYNKQGEKINIKHNKKITLVFNGVSLHMNTYEKLYKCISRITPCGDKSLFKKIKNSPKLPNGSIELHYKEFTIYIE